MNIYHITFDPQCRLFVPVVESDLDGGNLWINGTLKGRSWQAPIVRYSHQSLDNEQISDITQVTPGFFAFNEKAINALGDLLRDSGELLELPFEDQTFFAFNPHNEIDCIDANASEWKRRNDGSIGRLIKPSFTPFDFINTSMFQVPELRNAVLFVTDVFKDRYDDANLTGLIFTKSGSEKNINL